MLETVGVKIGADDVAAIGDADEKGLHRSREIDGCHVGTPQPADDAMKVAVAVVVDSDVVQRIVDAIDGTRRDSARKINHRVRRSLLLRRRSLLGRCSASGHSGTL